MISISSLSSNKDIKGTEHTDSQSRTQSPLAFWSAGGRQERLWRIRKIYVFFYWLRRNFRAEKRSAHFFCAYPFAGSSDP